MSRDTATGVIFTRSGCSIVLSRREARSDDDRKTRHCCRRARCGSCLRETQNYSRQKPSREDSSMRGSSRRHSNYLIHRSTTPLSIDEFGESRMDIDGMSYEQLLALGERIGYVATALTEEASSKCISRSNYTPENPEKPAKPEEEDKCSICQEEYAICEELGKLVCSHRYHMACIQEWFQMKNWCPVCKASMSPTNS